jgi:hypothetical protein
MAKPVSLVEPTATPPKKAKPALPKQMARGIDLMGGNYIITIGQAQSGKTTFQMSLIRYLLEGGGACDVSALPVRGAKLNSHALLNLYRDLWAKKRFMDSTDPGRPREYAFTVTPESHSPFVKTVQFGFFEASGEDFEDQIKFHKDRPPLFTEVTNALQTPRVRPAIILLADGAELDDHHDDRYPDDRFFIDFLTSVKDDMRPREFGDLTRRASIMIIVSKPDDAAELLATRNRKKTPDMRIATGTAAVQLVKTFLPDTLRHIQVHWGRDPWMARLTLGTLGSAYDEEHEQHVPTLEEPHFEHIAQIYDKIYRHFAGPSIRQFLRDRSRG